MLTHNQEQMVYWITERNNIRLKKEAGLPPPWTDNEVMQVTYFCNVNREDDRVTKWIRNNWHYKDGYKKAYTFAMIVARFFNLPSTLEIIGQPSDEDMRIRAGNFEDWLDNMEYRLVELRAEDKGVFNGAYIISTNGKKMGKIEYISEILNKAMFHPAVTKLPDTLLLSKFHKQLMEVEGLASFLAAQVVADIKNSKGHPLQQAGDWWTFSAFGPGSLRGLSWFWEKDIKPATYNNAIKEAYDLIKLDLPDDVIDVLCMQNFQNCFCEYDKFMRVTNGTGRSKRIYRKGK